MMCKTQSLGSGRLMVFTPLARHIKYNSVAHIEHFSMISSGRHMRKINARYTPGSSCTVKFLGPTIYRREGGRIRSTASYVMGRWRQEFIYFCFALSQELFGTRFCPGRISGCISHNRTLQAWLNGGRRQARCPNRNASGSMEYSFILCGIYEKGGIGGSSKTPT